MNYSIFCLFEHLINLTLHPVNPLGQPTLPLQLPPSSFPFPNPLLLTCSTPFPRKASLSRNFCYGKTDRQTRQTDGLNEASSRSLKINYVIMATGTI